MVDFRSFETKPPSVVGGADFKEICQSFPLTISSSQEMGHLVTLILSYLTLVHRGDYRWSGLLCWVDCWHRLTRPGFNSTVRYFVWLAVSSYQCYGQRREWEVREVRVKSVDARLRFKMATVDSVLTEPGVPLRFSQSAREGKLLPVVTIRHSSQHRFRKNGSFQNKLDRHYYTM